MKRTKIGISDTEQMLRVLSAGCRPGQFVRELVVNSIQAIGASGIGRNITADEDPLHPGMFAVIDDGPGMSEALLRDKWDLFYKSGPGNFGVGGKIASVARGSLLVRTWQEGVGFQMTLDRSGAKEVRPVAAGDAKPGMINKHGTIVTVLGNGSADRTIGAPAGVIGATQWVLKYLNTKFFTLPDGVTIRARYASELCPIHGLFHWMRKYADDGGKVTLPNSGFTANWWLLPQGRDDDLKTPYAMINNMLAVKGSVSLRFDDELYNMQAAKNEGGGSPLRAFGIYTGGNRVVIVLTPDEREQYGPNLQRSALEKLVPGGVEPVPLGAIASEFAEHLPKALKNFMADRDAKSQTRKDDYLDRKLYDVHGFDLVNWGKGKIRMPAAEGKVRPSASPRAEPSASGPSGDVLVLTPSEAKPKPPRDPQDGRVTAPLGKNRHFKKRRDLPSITVHNADDLPPEVWADYMDSDVRRLSVNRSWIVLEGHFAAVARRQGFPATDAQKEFVINRLIHNSKDGVLTAYEQRASGGISQDKFVELTGQLALTAAACPRSHLVNFATGPQERGVNTGETDLPKTG